MRLRPEYPASPTKPRPIKTRQLGRGMKPWHWRIAQTSRPEKTRNLPNGHLDLGHVDLPAEPPLDLLRGSGLEK
jgi:hypothetical protein